MTATSTVAALFKEAMFDAAVALWATSHPEMLVSYGRPGVNVPDDLCMFLGVESEQEFAAIGANTRQREETLSLEVQFWVFRPGEEDAEREATRYLYDRLGELEDYVRTTNTELGGLVRHCFLTRHQFDTTEAESGLNRSGRLAVATGTFQASVRIRN